MRLACKSCGARFTISDDLVRGKVVRLRCKQCLTIITARLPTFDPPQHLQPEQAPPRPPPLPERVWFAAVNDQQVGPLNLTELRLHIRRRELGPDDLVWRQGLGMWLPVVAVEELRDTLMEREPSQVVPPPLPPRGQSYPFLRVLPGGQAAAARPAPEPQPAEISHVAPRSDLSNVVVLAAPERVARWPYWAAILGGVMMLLATSAALLLRDRPRREAPSAEIRGGQRLQSEAPASDLPETAPRRPRVIHDLPPINVRRARPGGGARRATPAPIPERIPTTESPDATSLAEQLNTKSDDVKTALALQVFRRNRSTLLACDALAERRGETLRTGSRAEFRVRVQTSGSATVEVRGRDLSKEIVSCYRAVASQWQFPKTGTAYTTTFHHVH